MKGYMFNHDNTGDHDKRPSIPLSAIGTVAAPGRNTLIYMVNDTPNRHAELKKAREAGYDVVHIPPPPPWDDWEQYCRLFGRNTRSVRRYIKSVLRRIGREDLIAHMKGRP